MKYIFEISSKELRKEYKRKEYYDNIIKEYSTVIGRRNELNGNSKTAYRCKKDGISKGIKALMSRWFIFQELNGGTIKDCVIPSDPKEDRWLLRELGELGLPEDDQQELEQVLIRLTRKEFEHFWNDTKNLKDDPIAVTFEKDEHDFYHFTFVLDEKAQEIKIRKESLKDLYNKYNNFKWKSDDDGNPIKLDLDDDEFFRKVLLLMIRYETDNVGRRYQTSLPEGVFRYLKERYGLQHECFASPFNACSLIGSYCSRFRDTDTPFHARGSFFDFYPEEGVFECYPPFIEEILVQSIKHVLELLKRAEKNHKPMTFFIVAPAWRDEDCESYNRARYGTEKVPEDRKKNPFFKIELQLEKNSCFYRNGMSHQEESTILFSTCDSLMFVLQTSFAKPLEKNFEEEIMARWGVKSEEYKNNSGHLYLHPRKNEGNYQEKDRYHQNGNYRYRNSTNNYGNYSMARGRGGRYSYNRSYQPYYRSRHPIDASSEYIYE